MHEKTGIGLQVWLQVSKFEAFSSQEPFSLGHTLKIRLIVEKMIGFSKNCYFGEVEQFSLDKIILSTYVNTNASFLRNTSL